jgi:MFS family permease
MGITIHNTKPRAGLRRFIWQVCAFGFLNECVFIYSWYAVMFADHGLNAVQISILFAAWSITAFILEIPSGALADKYSRRHILAFAQVVRICGYACWMLFPTFWGFLAGFVCWGIKSAFASGTFEALVYDELKHHGAERDYAKLIGRIGVCANVGLLIAAVAAAPMIRLGYRAVILASLVPLAMSSIVVLTMRPAKKAESTTERHYFHVLKEGVREAVRNRAVLRLIVFLSVAVVFVGVLDEYWTLFYTTAGIPKPAIGILCVVYMAVVTVGEGIAYRFTRLPDRVFFAAYLLSGGLLLIGAHIMRPISVVCVLVFCFVLEITRVAMESQLQHSITGHARATATSVKGFAENVAGVALYLAFGAAAHKCGYRGGFMAFGATMIVIGAVYVVSEGAKAKRAGR